MSLRKTILQYLLPAVLLVACGPENVVNPVTPPAPKDDPTPEEPDTPDTPSDGVTMTICTFNIRYANTADTYPDGSSAAWTVRAPAVKQFIDETKPDLIGLQEIRQSQSTWFKSTFESEYGYYDVNRDNASGTTVATSGGEGVGFLYRKDRFELVMKDFFWLDDEPRTRPAQNKESDGTTTYGAWHTACRRVTVYGVFKDKLHGGSYVYFFPTHYDHKSSDGRKKAAELMVEQMKTICKVTDLKDAGSNVIIHVGDLNTTYESVELKPLRDNMNYARLAVDSPDKGTATFTGFGTKASIIDHIFYGGKSVKTTKYWVVSSGYGVPYLSDHNPVLCTFEYQ